MNRLSIGTWLLATVIAGGSAAQGEVASGERVFETRCATCHALDEHRLGPALRGVVGRPAASEPGYGYSSALKSVQFRWTAELLDRWLHNPSDFYASIAGLSDVVRSRVLAEHFASFGVAAYSDNAPCR